MTDTPIIQVGGEQLKEAAAPLAGAIIAIMAAPGDQKTIRAALEVFAKSVVVQNVTLSGATVDARTINIEPIA